MLRQLCPPIYLGKYLDMCEEDIYCEIPELGSKSDNNILGYVLKATGAKKKPFQDSSLLSDNRIISLYCSPVFLYTGITVYLRCILSLASCISAIPPKNTSTKC